jgi:hypothetical protein
MSPPHSPLSVATGVTPVLLGEGRGEGRSPTKKPVAWSSGYFSLKMVQTFEAIFSFGRSAERTCYKGFPLSEIFHSL